MSNFITGRGKVVHCGSSDALYRVLNCAYFVFKRHYDAVLMKLFELKVVFYLKRVSYNSSRHFGEDSFNWFGTRG